MYCIISYYGDKWDMELIFIFQINYFSNVCSLYTTVDFWNSTYMNFNTIARTISVAMDNHGYATPSYSLNESKWQR